MNNYSEDMNKEFDRIKENNEDYENKIKKLSDCNKLEVILKYALEMAYLSKAEEKIKRKVREECIQEIAYTELGKKNLSPEEAGLAELKQKNLFRIYYELLK